MSQIVKQFHVSLYTVVEDFKDHSPSGGYGFSVDEQDPGYIDHGFGPGWQGNVFVSDDGNIFISDYLMSGMIGRNSAYLPHSTKLSAGRHTKKLFNISDDAVLEAFTRYQFSQNTEFCSRREIEIHKRNRAVVDWLFTLL